MGGSYAFEGRATTAGLDALHELVGRIRRDHPEVDAVDLAMLETAVLELAGNVVEHGTPPDQIRYSVSVDVTADGLSALLVDTGDALPELDGASVADPLAESGRGLALARAALTELTYERHDDTNTWRMIRASASAPPATNPGGRPSGG